MLTDKLLGTRHARVYRYLTGNIGQSFMEAEIVSAIGVGRSAVNLAVRDLSEHGFIDRERRGRTSFYSVDPADPIARQLKIWETTLRLKYVVEKLHPFVRKIVLFGSAAEGLDTVGSDVDLFIVGQDRNSVRAIIGNFDEGRRIQAVIVSEQELATLKSDDPAFYSQIQRGLTLFEDTNGETEP